MSTNLNANLMSEKNINIIKKFMIFDKIESRHIKQILDIHSKSQKDGYHKRIAKLCQYNKGEIVIEEGAFDCWSFWVVKGAFDVIQDGTPIITFNKPGQIFGEMSVFEGVPRTASVVSNMEGICLCIDMSIIDTLDNKKISIAIKRGFNAVILERIGNTRKKIETEKRKLELQYFELLEFEKKIKSNLY